MSKEKYFRDNLEWFRSRDFELVPKCLICGEMHEIPQDADILQCSCGFAWMCRQPTQKVLDEFYNDSDPLTQWAEIKDTAFESNRQRKKFDFFWDFANDANAILDVGCGNGFFLNNVDSKVKKIGIEPNGAAQERCKFSTYNNYEDFKNSMHGHAKYDLITMFGVLEHVKDPLEELENYAKHVSDSGMLGFIVPNFESLAVKVLQDKCCTFCPQHLWHYTIRTMSALLSKVGFELLAWGTREAELQPILRKLKGMQPYQNLGFDLTDSDITEAKILGNGLGYKVCALYKKEK